MIHGPILVVDDEPANLALMRLTLAGDYSLIFARSGIEALRIAAKHRPALVLLDIQMPELDGYAVCRALKNDPNTADVPVIFVSGLSDEGNEASGFAVGAVDYISKPISPPIVRARVRAHLSLVRAAQLEESHSDAIHMLGTAGHYNDTDTGVHIWRMAEYARKLAAARGWNEEQCRLIELAAPMHDTGKIGIPTTILRKPGPLTEEEWVVMRTHTRIGHTILRRSPAPLFQLAATIALRHHERWDGSGYPDGLRGDAIPEAARIVAVADVFDALTMRRSYKEPWSAEQALAHIQSQADLHFDPEMVATFLEILPEIEKTRLQWQVREGSGDWGADDTPITPTIS